MQDGKNGIIEETPRKDNKIFNRVNNFIIGNNEIACRKAISVLVDYGIKTTYLGSKINLEAKVFGKELTELLICLQTKSPGHDLINNRKSFSYVLGGETVVNLNSTSKSKNQIIGIGGRNQETIVSSIKHLFQYKKKINDFTIICCGTDGIDGNSESAGGIITPFTLSCIEKNTINVNQ